MIWISLYIDLNFIWDICMTYLFIAWSINLSLSLINRDLSVIYL